LVKDLKMIREARWPNRGFAAEAFVRVHNNVDWEGISREAVLRMLGAVDGELAYREEAATSQLDLEGELAEVREIHMVPYLEAPADDRLIYRTGDGHNKNLMYVFRLEGGKVSSVEVREGF
jgi:hypothetical protein